MREKYRGLVAASVLLRFVGVVVALVGVGLCLWYLLSGERSELSRIVTIFGIGVSLSGGIVIYALGEVIGLVLDVREVVGEKTPRKE